MANVKGVEGGASGQPEPTPCGVWGDSQDGIGVEGTSAKSTGVVGISRLAKQGEVGEGGTGVYGECLAIGGLGVKAHGAAVGVVGFGDAGYGVTGTGPIIGVFGMSSRTGVQGNGDTIGVSGYSGSSVGVNGATHTGTGVNGSSTNGTGVTGTSQWGDGVSGISWNRGMFAYNPISTNKAQLATTLYAGDFKGNVYVGGNLTKSSGSFKIDHPLDPANKYLSHSFVESPDMKNIYDGVVTLDESGGAFVSLPEWFDALNMDFRYQLTPLGAAAPNLHVAEEVSGNSFKIGGGAAGMRVCWQLTGVRRDVWAEANRIQVEEEKPEEERGYYLHPHLYGETEEKGIRAARYSEPSELAQ
ncbi:MAG TPA: hypothetical protein VF297_13600 [Pyrinomonadaceae bacterium]